MSKGKFNRKRQRTKQYTEEKMAEIGLLERKIVPAEDQPKTPETAKENGEQEEEPAMGLREFFKHPSFTDWCIMAFTGVLAAVAIYQYVVMNGQLRVMRNDERAWLRFSSQSDTPAGDQTTITFTTGNPIAYPLRVLNIGKTPARHITMTVFVDILDATQGPPLGDVEGSQPGSVHPFTSMTSGIIFPNQDFRRPVVRLKKEVGGPLVAADDEVKAIDEGKAYLAVYGIIRYDDIFNVSHWTKFCDWIAKGSGQFHTSECVQYNNVDDNQ